MRNRAVRGCCVCHWRVWKKGWLSASFNGVWFGSFCFLFSGKCYQGRYLCAIMSRQLADGRRAFSSLGFAFMLGKGKFCWVWLGRSALRFHSWLTRDNQNLIGIFWSIFWAWGFSPELQESVLYLFKSSRCSKKHRCGNASGTVLYAVWEAVSGNWNASFCTV